LFRLLCFCFLGIKSVSLCEFWFILYGKLRVIVLRFGVFELGIAEFFSFIYHIRCEFGFFIVNFYLFIIYKSKSFESALIVV
jgi:hypothetical protein